MKCIFVVVCILVLLLSLIPFAVLADDGDYESLTEMFNSGVIPEIPPHGRPSSPAHEVWVSADGVLTFYSDRAVFNSTCPGMPIEDFEEARIADGTVASCARPVDSATNNAFFYPGDIESGLLINTVGPGQNGDELAVLGVGFYGSPSKCLVANYYIDSFAIEFTNGDVKCVGMDLMNFGYGGNSTLQINIYGTSGLLGSTTGPGSEAGIFWGVCSDKVITRIEFASPSNGAEGVDNVAFGVCQVAVGGEAYPVNKIILMAPLIALAVVIAIGAVYLIRRRVSDWI